MVLGCAPPSPELVIREPDDLSYSTGDIWRVEVDNCGYTEEPSSPNDLGTASVTLDSRFTEAVLDVVAVTPDCSEWPIAPIGPGEQVVHTAPRGNVVRVVTSQGEVHSAWQVMFFGGNVVLQ
jgi:hypothetical protein